MKKELIIEELWIEVKKDTKRTRSLYEIKRRKEWNQVTITIIVE